MGKIAGKAGLIKINTKNKDDFEDSSEEGDLEPLDLQDLKDDIMEDIFSKIEGNFAKKMG